MNIAEMHTQFKINVDKVDSFNSQNFEPEEIDVLLNTAQDELIKQLTRNGVEQTQSQQDMLAAITARVYLNAITGNFQTGALNKPGGTFVTLPDDYRKALNEEAIVHTLDCHGDEVNERRKVIPIKYDQYNTAAENPFVKPDKDYCHRLMYNSDNNNGRKQVEIIIDGLNPPDNELTAYILDYLRNPIQMQYGTQYPAPGADIDCELNIDAQQWIIEEASKQALLDIESQRYLAKEKEQDKLNY